MQERVGQDSARACTPCSYQWATRARANRSAAETVDLLRDTPSGSAGAQAAAVVVPPRYKMSPLAMAATTADKSPPAMAFAPSCCV